MKNRTRIKVCGVKDFAAAEHCAKLGVDALGFVFATGSPRLVSARHAAEIAARLPPFITTVALFMDQSDAEIHTVLNTFTPDVLQFHGAESAKLCRSFSRPYIKAVPMGGGAEPLEFAAQYEDAQAVLVDSNAMGQSGGSGHAFDWQALPAFSQPVIVAGGLMPENVGAAIDAMRPYGVDVSSGVESTRGEKDLKKISLFVQGVNSVR